MSGTNTEPTYQNVPPAKSAKWRIPQERMKPGPGVPHRHDNHNHLPSGEVEAPGLAPCCTRTGVMVLLLCLCVVLLCGVTALAVLYGMKTSEEPNNAVVLGPSAERCSMDWYSYGGKCYHFSHGTFDWTTGREKCASMGGHLVIIESKEEQMYITEKLNATDEFWIGLTDSHREGHWKWVDNSDLKNITFWHRGQPNNSSGINNAYVDGEDCAIMRYVEKTELNWFDMYCAQLIKIICEAKSM